MTDEQLVISTRLSLGYEICTGGMLFLDIVSAVLLVISMWRIYTTIKNEYSNWNPNKCFIAIQIFIFIAPLLSAMVCLIFYVPQPDQYNTLTYNIMWLYCLF